MTGGDREWYGALKELEPVAESAAKHKSGQLNFAGKIPNYKTFFTKLCTEVLFSNQKLL
jgi:hypothetical protein